MPRIRRRTRSGRDSERTGRRGQGQSSEPQDSVTREIAMETTTSPVERSRLATAGGQLGSRSQQPRLQDEPRIPSGFQAPEDPHEGPSRRQRKLITRHRQVERRGGLGVSDSQSDGFANPVAQGGAPLSVATRSSDLGEFAGRRTESSSRYSATHISAIPGHAVARQYPNDQQVRGSSADSPGTDQQPQHRSRSSSSSSRGRDGPIVNLAFRSRER